MNWSCCATTRKKTFKFENGTLVRASDAFRAIELLKSISLKNVFEIDNENNNMWLVKFHPSVFIKIEAPGPGQALRVAEWSTYLDRRETKIVGSE
jgi:hypothetical protein